MGFGLHGDGDRRALMGSCSLLVVNYRSAKLALDAIGTAQAAYAGPLQVVVVDNSVDPAEAELLRGVGKVIATDRNLGYSGAINAGRKWCDGETLLVCNPDVRFAPASIDRLIATGAAVAGPALFWDEGLQWMLPSAELDNRSQLLDRVLASRFSGWARTRDRRRTRARTRFWSLTATSPVPALSGAVMAIRAAAFDAAGGFDERYPLYFEEHDFLRRVSGEIVYVPDARVRHLYNQSARGSPEAASFYAVSEARYLRRWSGRAGMMLKRLERPMSARLEFAPFPVEGIELPEGDLVVEASPLPTFETAAGCFPHSRKLLIPEDIWACYRGEVLYVRIVDKRSGATIAALAKARMVV